MSPKSVASMIGQLKTNPKVYLQLLADGYVDEQVPEWVSRPAEGVAGLVEGAKVSGGVLAMPTKTQKTPALGEGSQVNNLSNTQQPATATNTPQQGATLSATQLAELNTEQLNLLGLNRDANRQVYRIQPGQGGSYTKIHYVLTEPTQIRWII